MTDIVIGGTASIIMFYISFKLYSFDNDDLYSYLGFSLSICGIFITIIELIRLL